MFSNEADSKWVVLVVITSFIMSFSGTVISVALPSISNSFAIDAVVLNFLGVAFFLSFAVFSVPFSHLIGKLGLRKSYALGIVVFLLGSIAASLSFSAYSLLFSRVICGVGASMMTVTGFTVVTKVLHPTIWGRSVGLSTSARYIGITLGPFLGGILTENIGWQSIFYVTIPLIIISLIISLKVKGEWFAGKEDPFDFIGTLIYSIGMLLFLYGFTTLNLYSGVILTIIGLVLLVGFVKWELRQRLPAFNFEIFKKFSFSSSALAYFIGYLSTFVVMTILNYHLQFVRGMSPQISGLILIVTPSLVAIISPFAGTLSNRIAPQKLSAIGMGLVTVAIFVLVFLDEDTSFSVIIFSMVLQGFGFGIFLSPITKVIMGSAQRKFAHSSSATLSTLKVIGQTMSLGLLTVVFAIVMGSVQIIPQYYPLLIKSSQITCIIITILSIITFFLLLIGVKNKKMHN